MMYAKLLNIIKSGQPVKNRAHVRPYYRTSSIYRSAQNRKTSLVETFFSKVGGQEFIYAD